MANTSHILKIYTFNLITKQLALIRRHKTNLLGEHSQRQLKNLSRRNCDVTHGGYDCNGFSLNPDKISLPDEKMLWLSSSIYELDECYTRRVMGFESVREMWQWVSCVDLMQRVTDFPLLMVNASDDPVVPPEVHSIPIQYTGNNR